MSEAEASASSCKANSVVAALQGKAKVRAGKWVKATNAVTNQASLGAAKTSLRERLQRADSHRSLIAANAKFARSVLDEFASIHRPVWKQRDAILFGALIDFAVLFRLPMGGPLTRAIVKHGGCEQLRFLFCVATFDADANGQIDDEEWRKYVIFGDNLIADSVAMCGNLAVVGALLLGLTHLITMGRPVAYEVSAASESALGGEWVLWCAYTFNTTSECAAFFTLCISVMTRTNLTNVLPTRELKIDMLRSSNALGVMGVSLMLTLWSFLLSMLFGTLVPSPTIGAVGSGLVVVCLGCCLWFIAPIRYLSVLLLHEEVKRFLVEKSGSFLKQALAQHGNETNKVGPESSFHTKVLRARSTKRVVPSSPTSPTCGDGRAPAIGPASHSPS